MPTKIEDRKTVEVLKSILTRLLLIVFILSSCGGNSETSYRCLSREEALTICLAEEIGQGLTMNDAKLKCEPMYQFEGCYE